MTLYLPGHSRPSGRRTGRAAGTGDADRMDQLSERLQTPISTAELERRWAAVRAAMEREKIDVLLMQNNNDHMGGYVKYFTDLPATNGYPLTVVFPRDDLMTLVSQGPFGGENDLDRQRRRHAPRRQAVADHAELRLGHYTRATTRSWPRRRWRRTPAARSGSSAPIRCRLRWSIICKRAASRTRASSTPPTWSTASRSIKSAEEMELIRRAAAMQDGAMRAAFAAVEPGMRDRDVAAIAQYYSQRHGSENGIYLCASMPLGTRRRSSPAALAEPRHPGGRPGRAAGRG